MDKNIKKIVNITEKLQEGKNFKKSKLVKIFELSNNLNLNVYKGILLLYYFAKFKEFPNHRLRNLVKNNIFQNCLFFLEGNYFSPPEVGNIFKDILLIPDKYSEVRDILMGCFYGAFWSFMNNPKNFKMAVEYGLAIVNSAFSLDNFNIYEKIKIGNMSKVINLGGSGKKEVKLLNISSMSAIITAAVCKAINKDLIVTKTVSAATSSVTGSQDIFELLGVNLNLSIEKMVDVACSTKLGIFKINQIVPKLNRVYDGKLYNVQVFAGLVGGASIVNPVDADLINYGLTRGSTKLCLAILSKLYPHKKIMIIQGKDRYKRSIIDQFSIVSNTEIAYNIKTRLFVREVSLQTLGFNYKPFSFKNIKTKKSKMENLKKFIQLLLGKGHKDLKLAVAMECALNLYGLKLVHDLKHGVKLAFECINSGEGIKILEDLVKNTKGDIYLFNRLIKNFKHI